MKQYEQARLWKCTMEMARKKAKQLQLSLVHFIHEAIKNFDINKYE